MKMKSAKLMTLMTAVALGVFSGGNVMAAGNGDFYMQPPADSGWQKANTEGAYASYTNGSDYINVLNIRWMMLRQKLPDVMINMRHVIRQFILRETACIWRLDMQKMQMISVK